MRLFQTTPSITDYTGILLEVIPIKWVQTNVTSYLEVARTTFLYFFVDK